MKVKSPVLASRPVTRASAGSIAKVIVSPSTSPPVRVPETGWSSSVVRVWSSAVGASGTGVTVTEIVPVEDRPSSVALKVKLSGPL